MVFKMKKLKSKQYSINYEYIYIKIKKNIIVETIDIGQSLDSPHHQSINDMVIYKSKNKENIIIAGSGII